MRRWLVENTSYFRARMTDEGFDIVPGDHPIVPVMIGDEERAAGLAAALVERGIYAVRFSYSVVPRGAARIRTQMSAAYSRSGRDRAADAFRAARDA